MLQDGPRFQVNQARQSEARRSKLNGAASPQGLGRLELLGLLQGFLCHVFVLPLNLPLWGDAFLHAIDPPLFYRLDARRKCCEMCARSLLRREPPARGAAPAIDLLNTAEFLNALEVILAAQVVQAVTINPQQTRCFRFHLFGLLQRLIHPASLKRLQFLIEINSRFASLLACPDPFRSPERCPAEGLSARWFRRPS